MTTVLIWAIILIVFTHAASECKSNKIFSGIYWLFAAIFMTIVTLTMVI